MNPNLITNSAKSESWKPLSGVTVGKDILELLSSSMYVDPMTIYREYIQNAADSIDEAIDQGTYPPPGRIDIFIDPAARSVRIRDNGIGVRRENFESQLGTFGGSKKRGAAGRGFRGVGRLSGLGYCQKLTFRTLASGDKDVSEMVWDCRKIKNLLNSNEKNWTLEDLLTQVVSVRSISHEEPRKPFFEVELSGVVRHKNDVLLNRQVIYDYLSEVAPVPFHPDFSFGTKITQLLGDSVALGRLNIFVGDDEDPVYRPYRDEIKINGETYDRFTDLELYSLPANDEGVAALGWFLHHQYKGALPDKRLGGLRARCGNIQIGGRDLFAEVFKESRFNSWTVGEVHIIDGRITPNGRRDYFEQGVHLDNLLNKITPKARSITALCRESSRDRNKLQDFERLEASVKEKLRVLEEGLIDEKTRTEISIFLERSLGLMSKSVQANPFKEEIRQNLLLRTESLQESFSRTPAPDTPRSPFDTLTESDKAAYERMIGLIYSCSESPAAARKLVARILERVTE
jgi:Histidine kinase-, DNA gyrase B-, and HSP90-like ATPase